MNPSKEKLLKTINFILTLSPAVIIFRFFVISKSTLSAAVISGYIPKAIAYDVLFLVMIGIIHFFLSGISKKLRIAAEIVIFALLTILYSFYAGYFSVFESYFSLSSLGEGLSTYSNEIINSALHEIDLFVYVFALIFSIVFLLYFILSFRIKKIIVHFLLFTVFPFFAALIFLIKSSYANTGTFSESLRPPYQNPFFFLVIGKEEVNPTSIRLSERGEKYLNTDSLLTNEIIPSLKIPKKKYNIIFYFFESTSQKYWGMEVNSKKVTPVWEKLSQNSIYFPNHYAHYPLSVNALYNVLSSEYNPEGKMWIPMHDPEIPIPSISEIFKNNGYKTALFHSGDLKNFNHINYLKKRKIDLILDIKTLNPGKYKIITPYSLDDRVMIEPLIDFIQKDPAKPFFAALFPVLPHHPYTYPFKEFYLYSEDEIGKNPDRKARTWMRYVNSLYFSDYCLGKLVQELDSKGLLENTLLFIFADHGEAFYQHPGNYLHAIDIYDENVRVPFIIYGKNIFRSRITYPSVSRHIDITPTALDFAGIKPHQDYQGVSLISQHKKQMAFSYTDWDKTRRSVRDGKWKLIQTDKKFELYDIENDPEEKTNLAAIYPDKLLVYSEFLKKAEAHQYEFYKSRNYKIK